LYDGPDISSPLLGRFCGNKRPTEAVATGSHMFAKFHSDTSVQKRGFEASHTTVCGGKLVADSTARDIFSHPQYGDTNYISARDCSWTIVSAGNNGVQLDFIEFELELENDCSYDYVEVYDGRTVDDTRLGRFCGDVTPPTLVSTSRAVLIRFTSDDTINKKGFKLRYYSNMGAGEDHVN